MVRFARACALLLVAVAVSLPGSAQAATPTPAPLGPDFLWGVASAGFQNEGNPPDSNWTRYVAGNTSYDKVGTSVDFRHRYASDIQLARDLGVKVYRLSIEWSRIEPSPGHWDQTELAYYDDVLDHIVAAGMKPMITIDHWVYPGWEATLGGWSRAGMLDDWLANARLVVNRYAKYNPMWITINEPSAYLLMETRNGGLNPLYLPYAASQLVKAHRSIYDYIHSRQPRAMVSSNVAYFTGLEDVLDLLFMNQVSDKLDFIGVDYYYSATPTDLSVINSFTGDMWKASVSADGLYYALRHYAKQFPGKPLYVVENGMPTENGKPRPDGYKRGDLLRDDIYWLQRAKADGMNVIGYNYWSMTDNYEWGSYSPRFGLYTVDVKTDPTLTRHPTDAVAAYKDLIANGGVAAAYVPTRPPVFCSIVDLLDSCLRQVQ